MDITITENRQTECTRQAKELFGRLSVAANEAKSMINWLNSQKIRIFSAKVKLFFAKLNNSDDSQVTGKRPKKNIFSVFKDVFVVPNELKTDDKTNVGKTTYKKYAIALVLVCIPYTGFLGIHDFYLGRPIAGVIKLLTGNFAGIGWVIDIIRIVTKNYTDGQGKALK